jgi:hypothetical protein
MNNEAITEAAAANLPRTIRELIAATNAIGGEVTQISTRLFQFALPCRVVGGDIRLVARGTVGYFVSEGKNRIKGSADIRRELAYWAKQSGR